MHLKDVSVLKPATRNQAPGDRLSFCDRFFLRDCEVVDAKLCVKKGEACYPYSPPTPGVMSGRSGTE
jgi:hypothetical protein